VLIYPVVVARPRCPRCGADIISLGGVLHPRVVMPPNRVNGHAMLTPDKTTSIEQHKPPSTCRDPTVEDPLKREIGSYCCGSRKNVIQIVIQALLLISIPTSCRLYL